MMWGQSVQRSQARLESRKYIDCRSQWPFIAVLSVTSSMSVPCYFCISINTWMWFFSPLLRSYLLFSPIQTHCIIKQMGACGVESLWPRSSQDQDTTQYRKLGITWGWHCVWGCRIFVSTGSKSSQICFGRDPGVLVSLIAFPTTLHDYQIMCSRI